MRSGCRSKGSMVAGNNRKRPYGMMLLLALGAAVLGVAVLHRLRERRVFGLLLQEKDHQLLAIQLLLQKERDQSRELKRRLEDMKEKMSSLRTQRTQLSNKVMEVEATATHLDNIKRETETALAEKQNQINTLTEKKAESIKANLRVATLMVLLRQKEAEVEQLRQRLTNSTTQDNTTKDNNVSTNGHTEGNSYQESAGSQEMQLGKYTNSTDEKASVGERQVSNVNETISKNDRMPEEGQWVKLTTNVDDEDLEDRNESDVKQTSADVLGDQRLEKTEGSHDSKQSEGVQMSRESSRLDVIEQRKESENMEMISTTGEGNTLKPREMNSTGTEVEEREALRDGKSEEPAVSRNRSRQQVTHIESKSEDAKMKDQHHNRKKSKRHKIATGGMDLDKQNDGHSKNSENDEKIGVQRENAETSMTEGNRGTSSADNQSNMPENSSVTESLTTRAQDNHSDEVEGKKEAVLLNDGRSEMTTDASDEASKISSEDRKHRQVDASMEMQYGTSEEKLTKTFGGSKDDDSKDNESSEMSEQKSTSGTNSETKKKAVLDNLQQQKSSDPEVTEGKPNQKDGFNEISHSKEGEEAVSTEKQSQTNGNSQQGEGQNERNNSTYSLSADLTTQEGSDNERKVGDDTVVGKSVAVDTISSPKQTEASNINHENKNPALENTTETNSSPNSADSNNKEDQELKDDPTDQNGYNMAEF